MSGLFGVWNRDGRPVDLEQVNSTITTFLPFPGDQLGFLLANTESGRIINVSNDQPRRLEEFSADRFNLVIVASQPIVSDLGDRGRQPMSDPSGKVHAVYDGEIYNRADTGKSLGVGDSDESTVISSLFASGGIESLVKLNGLFVAAFWDMEHRKLTLARDHVGGRSLFYAQNGRQVVFSTSIKGILSARWIPAEPCHWAIRQFLDVRCPAMTQTWVEGVHRLSSGTYVEIRADDTKTGRYWNAEYAADKSVSETEYVEQLRHEITESARRRLTDLDISCAHLSGGVDSSAIVSILSHLSPGKSLQTYSGHYAGHIGDENYDETDDARQVVKAVGARQKFVVVNFEQLQEVFPAVVDLLEEPYAVGAFAQYCVFRETGKDGYKVLFCGEGGDELFAGYAGRHTEAALLDNLSPIPNPIGIARAGWHTDDLRVKSLLLRCYPFKPWHRSRIKQRHDAPFNSDILKSMRTGETEFVTHPRPRTHLARELVTDYGVELSYLMPMEHLLGARFGMIVRSPLTDPAVVRLAQRMPVRMLLRGSTTKYSLRKAAEQFVPKSVIWRKKKMGFTPPIVHGLRQAKTSEYCRDLLISDSAPDFFDRQHLTQAIDQHVAGAANHETLLWRMMYISQWSNVFQVAL